jgi:hypothetical protein
MREFFRGWRRKVGCVMLAVACGLVGMWLRSSIVSDEWFYVLGEQQYLLLSSDGHVSSSSWSVNTRDRHFGVTSIPKSDPLFLWKTIGIQGAAHRSEHWTRGYWQLAIPLTLLSAYLILWKPRKRALS